MSTITIYHNPNFLKYRGDHGDIPPPLNPVASVTVPDALAGTRQALEYAYSQTQHIDDKPWFTNHAVRPHLRSTSVGDLAATEDGALFVVESMGFEPFRPQAITPRHKLAEAQRLLAAVESTNDARQLLPTVTAALATVNATLAANGWPQCDTPILWQDAQPGDLIGNDGGAGNGGGAVGQTRYRLITRKLRPKWRARRIAEAIADAEVWIDGTQTWAVLVPVAQEDKP
jgi:hypothetical protein